MRRRPRSSTMPQPKLRTLAGHRYRSNLLPMAVSAKSRQRRSGRKRTRKL